jgi:hypothetical protein
MHSHADAHTHTLSLTLFAAPLILATLLASAWAEAEEKTDFVKEAAAAPAAKKVKEKTVFAEPYV